jgi:hypothetical protein
MKECHDGNILYQTATTLTFVRSGIKDGITVVGVFYKQRLSLLYCRRTVTAAGVLEKKLNVVDIQRWVFCSVLLLSRSAVPFRSAHEVLFRAILRFDETLNYFWKVLMRK